jgi:diguanylate cyclase (GGDEF)-like protein
LLARLYRETLERHLVNGDEQPPDRRMLRELCRRGARASLLTDLHCETARAALENVNAADAGAVVERALRALAQALTALGKERISASRQSAARTAAIPLVSASGRVLLEGPAFSKMLEFTVISSSLRRKPLCLIIAGPDDLRLCKNAWAQTSPEETFSVISQLITRIIRERDLLAMAGEDEFAVIIPDTDLRGGLAVAERLRQEVEKKLGAFPGVRISAGLGCYPSDAQTSEELLRRTRQARHMARLLGGNMVQTVVEQTTEPALRDRS